MARRQNSPPHIHNPNRNIKTQKSHRKKTRTNKAEIDTVVAVKPFRSLFAVLLHKSNLRLGFRKTLT
jgi:hypothetical protein